MNFCVIWWFNITVKWVFEVAKAAFYGLMCSKMLNLACKQSLCFKICRGVLFAEDVFSLRKSTKQKKKVILPGAPKLFIQLHLYVTIHWCRAWMWLWILYRYFDCLLLKIKVPKGFCFQFPKEPGVFLKKTTTIFLDEMCEYEEPFKRTST